MALPKDVQEKVMIDAETNVSESDMKQKSDGLLRNSLDNGDVRCKLMHVFSSYCCMIDSFEIIDETFFN